MRIELIREVSGGGLDHPRRGRRPGRRPSAGEWDDHAGGEPQVYAAALVKNLDTFSADGRLPPGAAELTLTNLQLVMPQLPPGGIDLAQTYDDSFLNRATD